VVTRTGRVEIETRLGEVGTCGLEEEELSWVVTRGLFLSRQSGSLGSENCVAVFSLVVAVSTSSEFHSVFYYPYYFAQAPAQVVNAFEAHHLPAKQR
jgi:hypothetical protein